MVSDLQQHCNQPPQRQENIFGLTEVNGEPGICEWWFLKCSVCGQEYKEMYQFWPKPEWITPL